MYVCILPQFTSQESRYPCRLDDTGFLSLNLLASTVKCSQYTCGRLFQINAAPAEGINTLENAYAGELPLFARGTPGSDLATEGRSNAHLYDKETAKKIMGGDTKPDNVYTVAVNITNIKKTDTVMEILRQYGADIKIKEINH
ncbi:MAG: hypothetical protein GX357_03600 [Firmicutes bacterium]|nr:hypothetical protein [Bacillota bacterium]